MVCYYVGVDVGTASVRAALVDSTGSIKVTAEESIYINNPKPDFYEQSSDEIWSKCCKLIKKVTENVSPIDVHGIGFDATCSLVILDDQFSPVAVNVNTDHGKCFDVIMWMDHRAKKQTEFINSGNHNVLKYVGGKMSLEMQPPKLLWLKQNLPSSWSKASYFFDLSDFLTYRASGCLSRSLCSVVCKWTYSAQDGWDEQFWRNIGLAELTKNNFASIGSHIVCPGSALGNGLTKESAVLTNLRPGIAVSAALIDAHCGGVGTIGSDVTGLDVPCMNRPITERISFICGTSACHMALSDNPLFVPGVWGPYFSAMVPDLWLNEGGQSATGSVIDRVVQSHPAVEHLKSMAKSRNQHLYESLNHVVRNLADSKSLPQVDFLTQHVHVSPDFHGNRSPLADPTLTGAICGLTLDLTLHDLAKQYLATVQSLACGSRHILDTLEKHGHNINTVFMCGGLSKNQLFVQIHANILKKPIVLGKETEAVLLGAAILGACASNDYPSIQAAMSSMCKPSKVVHPITETCGFNDRKYEIYLAMLKHQLEYKTIMNSHFKESTK